MHTFIGLVLAEETTDDVADTGGNMHEWALLSCAYSEQCILQGQEYLTYREKVLMRPTMPIRRT